jgi:hypothetical protein
MTSGSLVQGKKSQAQEEASLSAPEAVARREASRTKYEALTAESAASVDREAFPSLVDEPAGGPPVLPEGQRMSGFVDAYVADVDLGGGEHGIVESSAPMALGGGAEGWKPINLALSESDGSYVAGDPKRSLSENSKTANGRREVHLPAKCRERMANTTRTAT